MKLLAPVLATLCMASFAPDAMAGGREPGSLLIYPIHRSGATGGVAFFTILSVTNTNLLPATVLSLGGSTNVHFNYINVARNPLNTFRPFGCSLFDRVEALTPADTLSVLTGCHNATFGAQEGYVVVYAENPTLFQTPWSHNHLLGSELVIGSSGITYELEAIALRSPVAAGAPTDLNSNGARDFDGAEYEQIADRLYISSFVAIAEASLTLTNLTGTDQDVNRVLFSVWNDFEFPLSATVDFNCWFEARLSQISTLFTDQFLAGTPNDPIDLDVNCDNVDDFQTGWAIIQSQGVRNPGGVLISPDGALVGAVTSGVNAGISGGRLLGESVAKQANGQFAH